MDCAHCKLELNNCDYCYKKESDMTDDIFSGERLNIDPLPLVKELMTLGYVDLSDLMTEALEDYLNMDSKRTPTKRIQLNVALNKQKVSIPTDILHQLGLKTVGFRVDNSYIYTMAIKDLHTRKFNVVELPY